jgi:hypothetical protein
MLLPDDTDALAETIRLMRAVRVAREALDASTREHAVLKGQIKAIADRTTALSDEFSRAVTALAAHARLFPFPAD